MTETTGAGTTVTPSESLPVWVTPLTVLVALTVYVSDSSSDPVDRLPLVPTDWLLNRPPFKTPPLAPVIVHAHRRRLTLGDARLGSP